LALVIFILLHPKSLIGLKYIIEYSPTVNITCIGITTISVAGQGEWPGSRVEQMVCPAKDRGHLEPKAEIHMP
jgi:hypothetical protein